MTKRLEGKRVVILLAEGFEDLEFNVPVMRLQEEGADVTVAGTHRRHGARQERPAGARPDDGRRASADAPGSTPSWCPAVGRPTSCGDTTR